MEDDGGLFNIDISSSDESLGSPKESRDHQSEANFQQQKAEWKPKIEEGQIWKSLSLPIDHPSKPDSQTILHAIEELYFYECYEDAKKITTTVLEGRLQDDFRKILVDYLERCKSKLATIKSRGQDLREQKLNNTDTTKNKVISQ